MRYLTIVILIGVCFIGISAKAQPKLTTDLLFVGFTDEYGLGKGYLARVDAQTGSIETFYTDDKVMGFGLYPISWSPDGKLLAIHRAEQVNPKDPTEAGFLSQICLITREGKLQTCSKNQALMPELNPPFEQYTNVTWSPDSQYFYFLQRVEGFVQLAQANTQTGETIKTIYDIRYDKTTYRPTVNWSTDFNQLLISTPDGITRLVDLRTKTQIELTNLETLGKTEDTMLRICYDFSPKNTYFTALAEAGESLRRPTLMNTTGQVLAIADRSFTSGLLRVGCPAWRSDESAMFFVGVSDTDVGARVFRYTFADDKLEVVHRYIPTTRADGMGQTNGVISGKLAVSPDGMHVAGLEKSSDTVYGWKIAVVSLDGGYQTFQGDYYSALYPIWVPPQ
jgi:WD40 repeat protein